MEQIQKQLDDSTAPEALPPTDLRLSVMKPLGASGWLKGKLQNIWNKLFH